MTMVLDTPAHNHQSKNVISLEANKLELMANVLLSESELASVQDANDKVSLGELVEYLIESLEDADTTTANRAENLLVRIGNPAVPYLLKGLKSPHTSVKSVCAMALIRIGQPAVEGLKDLYVRMAGRPQFKKHQWVIAFVLSELGEALPVVELANDADDLHPVMELSVIGLSKVG
ncbi:MAG: hypothetical protein VKJ04_07725 [Vampirovibrionales bacterium]|nr:hypothetical protein [Vampirovibrionales bacterium]